MSDALDKNIQAKLMKFCAYHDRSIAEVIDKMYKLNVWKEDHDLYINYLIDNLFLDEQRFTESFVRGKFRIKKWGKQKIKIHLKQKGIASRLIDKALEEQIQAAEYEATIKELLQQKEKLIKESDPFKRGQKLVNYLLQKGFENELIFKLLNED